ncbi:MAG: SpoIIE family protein phosphatase [Gemmatimonadetes bacterium]|nr:SpoIIE family protein phosphatase [Gemmatimonadota bacterium]
MPEESSGRTSPGRPPTARPSAAETALAGLTAPDRRKTPRPDSLELRLDAALRERRSDSRILIVDDTATNRKLLRAILANEGCEILEATDGEEGLRLARETQPDLVLLDVVMPKRDGYDVCAELKADRATAEIPVLFLSAKTESADKIRGLELGAVDYVTKPFHRGEILARVRTHLENRRLARALRQLNRELLRNQRRLEEDLRAAAMIQSSLIPSESLKDRFDELRLEWAFRPCQAIGGDVFHVLRLDPDHVGIYIVDVAGHGVPSAMVTVSVSQCLSPVGTGLLKERIPDPPYYRLPGPAKVLERLEAEFPLDRFDKYFTAAYLLFDLQTGKLRYSRAAHPSPVLLRKGGELETLEEGGSIIGLGMGVPFREGATRLEVGDRLFLFTDGIHERLNHSGERYGARRLGETLSRFASHTLEETCAGLLADVEEHAGGLAATDDVTVLALEYRGSTIATRRARRS